LERSVVREWDRSWGEPRVISPLKVETEAEAETETETETEAEAETETETEVAMGCVWAVSALPNSDFNIALAMLPIWPWPCMATCTPWPA